MQGIAGAWARVLARTDLTREKIAALPDMDEYSMRLLSLLEELFHDFSFSLVMQLTFWCHQLHAARTRQQ